MKGISLNILMIDDTPSDIQIMKRKLENLDVENEMITCNSTDEALAYLNSLKERSQGMEENPEKAEFLPDFIILDLHMPGGGGFDVLDKLKEEKFLASIPVIVNSSTDSVDDLKKTYKKGAIMFLSKFDDERALKEVIYQMRSMGILQKKN